MAFTLTLTKRISSRSTIAQLLSNIYLLNQIRHGHGQRWMWCWWTQKYIWHVRLWLNAMFVSTLMTLNPKNQAALCWDHSRNAVSVLRQYTQVSLHSWHVPQFRCLPGVCYVNVISGWDGFILSEFNTLSVRPVRSYSIGKWYFVTTWLYTVLEY